MRERLADHQWAEEALFNKSLVYVGRMEGCTADDWQFGFWSALSLELLARAALAHLSPILLADAKANWRNLWHALGNEPTEKKFSPASISARQVVSRLSELVPGFKKEDADFCASHLDKRNAELHSGEAAFAGLGTSSWLPRLYAACQALLKSMGRDLEDLFSDAEAARGMIASLEDAAAKAVKQDISSHAKVWSHRSEEDREKARAQAKMWATRQKGHRVTCPACDSPALLNGSPAGAVSTELVDDQVVQRQTMMPSSFECIACGLRINGLSKLSACGLGDAFTAKSSYPAAEFFGLYTEDELEEARAEFPDPGWEPDFNEY